MKFDTENAHFEALIRLNSSVHMPTELYLNTEYWYNNDFEISLIDENE